MTDILVSTNIESYEGFFKFKESKVFQDEMDGTEVENHLFNLFSSWRGISNARRLPWLMTYILNNSINNNLKRYIPFAVKLFDTLENQIALNDDKFEITLSEEAKDYFIHIIKDVKQRIIQSQKFAPSTINLEDTWNELINNKEFTISLWMSEINAYSSIYFFYENFVVNVVKLLSGEKNIQAS